MVTLAHIAEMFFLFFLQEKSDACRTTTMIDVSITCAVYDNLSQYHPCTIIKLRLLHMASILIIMTIDYMSYVCIIMNTANKKMQHLKNFVFYSLSA